MSDPQDKLAGVKPGDVLATSGFGREVHLHRVAKVTSQYAVTERNARFRIRDGRQAGECSSWAGRTYARFATEEDRMAVRVRLAGVRLRDFRVTPENVEAVEKLLNIQTEDSQ